MEAFWSQFLARYVLFAMLLIAWPFKRAVQLYMPDCRLKRFLLFYVSPHCKWCEHLDARINALGLRILRRCLGALHRK